MSPKPVETFEWVDAPGVRIPAPPKSGPPWDVIFLKKDVSVESILRVRSVGGCNTEIGCLYFGNQYFPVGPLQVVSPLGNDLRVEVTEEHGPKGRDVLVYTLFPLEGGA